jgi:hypothetical protein
LAVVVMGPEPFLSFASTALKDKVAPAPLAMASGFLSMIIWLLCDRTHAGDFSKDENKTDQLRYILVNLLLTKRNGMTHSFIKSRTPSHLRPHLEATLEEVGVYRAPSASQQSAGKGGVYTANPKFLHLYDPFYTRLYRDDAEKAEETMQEMRKDKEFLPPTRPVPLKPGCAPVLGLLGTDWLKAFVCNVLALTLGRLNTQNTQVPRLIHGILYLLQLDLTFNPEAPALLSWAPASTASSTDVLSLVHKVYSQPELRQEKQAAEWLLRSYAAREPAAKALLLELGFDLKSGEQEAAPKAEANRQRQEDMLRMFKAQQAAFAAASGFDDLSEEEDEAVAEEKDVCILCHEEKLNEKMLALACVELTNLLPQDADVSVRLCGHCVHFDCVTTHFVGLLRQRSFRGLDSELCRLNLLEFLCPLCKAFTNAGLPITWEVGEASANFVAKLEAVGTGSTNALFRATSYTTLLTEYRARTPGNTLLFDQRNLRLVRLLLRSAGAAVQQSGPMPSHFDSWLTAFLASPANPPSLVPHLLDVLLHALKHNDARPGPEDEAPEELASALPQLRAAGFPPLSRALVTRYMTPLLRQAALVLAASGRTPPFLPEAEGLQFSILMSFLDISLSHLANRLPAALSHYLPRPTFDLSWRPFALIPLPDEFEDLLLKYYSSTCSNCHQRPKEPSLCLRCGIVICLHGCQTQGVYQATAHSASCGKGNGIFLSYPTGLTVLVHRNWGVIYSSLYLNQHGEVCHSLLTSGTSLGSAFTPHAEPSPLRPLDHSLPQPEHPNHVRQRTDSWRLLLKANRLKFNLMLGADSTLQAGREGFPGVGEVAVHHLRAGQVCSRGARGLSIVASSPPALRNLPKADLQAVLGLIHKVGVALGALCDNALAVAGVPSAELGAPGGGVLRRCLCGAGT